MRQIVRTRKFFLVLVAVAAVAASLLFAHPAKATVSVTRPTITPKPLHLGSSGKRVGDLQWLLSGHTPSAYRSIKTYRGKIDRHYGKATANAVWNMKYRLGYPVKYLNKVAGYNLFRILKGDLKRPLPWIANAAKRQARIKQRKTKITQCQDRVVKYAVGQIGVTEYPWGSNRGPGISWSTSKTTPSFESVTGAYGAPWCASFAQWVLYKSAVGPIADRSAGVFYIRQWAYYRGLLRSTPERGTLVLFLWSAGHMGVVVRVTEHGFYTVEGNTTNAVHQRYYTFAQHNVAFVYIPRCS